jgi:hypothetical protein
MARARNTGTPDTVGCAVSGCGAVATGFYTLNGDTVVIHVGRPRREHEIPLCTLHTWDLSRDMLADVRR